MAIQIETYSQDDFLQLRTDWEQLQTGKEIRVIDFTRGDEPYKLALGGIRKINNTVKFYYK